MCNPKKQWIALVVWMLCIVPLLSSLVLAQNENSDERIIQRYKQVLQQKPKAGSTFDRLYQFYLEGAGLEAMITDYQAEAKAKPNNANIQLILGHIYKRLGKEVEAIAAYQHAVELAPNDYYPHFVLGQTYVMLRRHEEAIAALTQAAKLSASTQTTNLEDVTAIYKALGGAYFSRDQVNEAIAAWQKIAELDAQNIFSRIELAELFREQQLYSQAIAQHQAIIQLKKDDPYRVCLSLREIGKLQEEMGEYNAAIQTYDAALARTAPGNWLRKDLQQRLIDIYAHNGDWPGLIAYYQSKLKEAPNDVEWIGLLADAYIENEQLNEGIAQYRKGLELAPTTAELRLKLIAALRGAERFAEAAAAYEILCEQQPDEIGIYRELGELYLKIDQPERAKATYQRFIDHQPDDAGVRLILAEIYAGHGWTNDAIAAYQRAIELAPENLDYIEYFGEFYFRQGNRQKTIETWNQLVEGKKATAANYSRLAQLLDGKEFREEGFVAGRKAVQLAPNEYRYREELAKRLMENQDYEAALVEYEAAARLAPNEFFSEQMGEQMIEIYRRQGVLAEKIAALETKPESFDQRKQLAKMYLKLGNLTYAVEMLNRAKDLKPEDVRVNRWLAEVYESQGRFDESVSIYKRLSDMDKGNAREYYAAIARSHLRVMNFDSAIEAAKQVIAYSPRNPEGYQLMADIAKQVGRYSEAIESLKGAIRLRSESTDIRAELANVYRQSGDYLQAIEQYWRCWELSDNLGDKLRFIKSLSDAYSDMGRSGEFEEKLRQMEKTNPSDVGPVLALAELYRMQGDLPTAREQLARALERDQDNPELLEQLVKISLDLGDTQEALKYQQRLVKVQPDVSHQQRLGELLFDIGREQEAIQTWTKLVHLKYKDVNAEIQLARLLIRHGLLGEALLALDRAGTKSNDAKTVYQIAASLVEMNELDRAVPHFQRILSMTAPPAPSSLAGKGAGGLGGTAQTSFYYGPPGLEDMRRFQLPQNLVWQIQQPYAGMGGQAWLPSSFEEAQAGALVQLVTIAQRQRKLNDLIAQLEAKSKANPNDLKVLETVAQLYILTQNIDKTSETIERLIALSPNDPTYQALQFTYSMQKLDFEMVKKRLERMSQMMSPEARLWYVSQYAGMLYGQGKKDEMEKLLPEIENAKVTDVQTGAMLIGTLTQMGKIDTAEKILAQIPAPAVPTNPPTSYQSPVTSYQSPLWGQYTSIYQSLANAYLREGRLDKGVELFWNVLERTQPTIGSSRVVSLAYSSVSYGGYTPLQSSFPSPTIYYDENRVRMLQQFFNQLWTQNQLEPLYAKLQAELGKASPPAPSPPAPLPKGEGSSPHQGGGSYETRVYPGLALSYCYWWEGQRKKAQEVLATLQTENPEDLTLKLNTAFISIQTGEHQRAMDLLDELAEKDPRNRQQYNDLIFQVAIQTGNAIKIREVMTKVLNSPVNVRELQQFSRRLQENGLTSYAIAVAKKAMTLAMGQRDPNLLMELSQHLEQLGRGQDAAVIAERAVRFANQRDRYGQTMYPWYFQQASQLLRRSKVTQAREGQLVEAAEKNPNSFQAQISLATYYASVNQVDKATKAYDQALSLRPKDSNTRQQYAQMLRNGGRHADAVTQYMILLKDNPNALGYNYWDVMETFFQAGKVVELVSLVKETISPSVGQNFGNDFAQNAAQRCLENSNPKAAAEIYEKLLSAQPNNPYMYAQLASAYAAAGDREKAIQFLRAKLDSADTAIAQNPDARVQMVLKLVELYKASGDIATLMAEYEARLAEKPDETSLIYLVATIRIASGKIEESDALVSKLIDDDTVRQIGWFNALADAYRNAGDRERELRLLEAAIQKGNPQNSWEMGQTYEKLGAAYAQKGEKEKAADVFRKMGNMRIMQYGGGYVWEKRRIADTFMQYEMWDDAEAMYTEVLNDLSADQYLRQESQRRLMEIQQRRAGLSTTTKLAEKTAAMNTATQRALAQEYMNRNELAKAAELFQKIVEAMPEDLGSQAQLAQIYSRQNKHNQAIAQWQALLEADPENTQYQDGLVNAYQAAGKIPEALALAQKYIESDPSGIPYTRLGRVYAAGDRVDDAINAYQKAIQLSPGDGRVYQELAQLYLRKNDFDKAEKAFQGAIQYMGQEWERRNIERQMIDLYRRQGKLEEMLNKAEKEGMLTFEMQTERAREYRNQGKLEKAVEAYKKAMDLTTQPWEKANVSNELVQVYAQLGQDELAIEIYENLSQSGSSSGMSIMSTPTGFRVQFGADQARETLINAYRSQGKQAQLAGYFEERLKKEPENPAILEMVAEIYRTSGDHAKSAESYLRLCKAQPGNVRSFYYAAAEFTQNSQPEQAADLLKQGQVALSSSNRNQDLWFLGALGTICLEGKLYDVAIKLFEDAISQSGRYGGSGWERQQFYRALGQSYLGAKRYEEAIRAYQQMVNIATDDNARQEAQNAIRKAYKEGGLYGKLIEQRLQAVKDNPGDPDAHYALAQTYEWNEMYDEAIAEYEKISQIQPDNVQWYKTLGNLYLKQREIKGSVSDRALSLDGDGDYVEIIDSSVLNNLDFHVTVEGWIKPTAFPNRWMPILFKGDKRNADISNRSYTLWVNQEGYIYLTSSPGNAPQIGLTSPHPIQLNEWHHIAGVIDGKNRVMKLFIDGNEVASRDFGGDIHISHLPFRIGWTHEAEVMGHAPFTGQIDDVRIWSVARTQLEIRANMNAKLKGDEPFLVGYWRFDEGEAGKAYDASPNHNDGKLVGDAKIVQYDRPIFAQPAPEKLVKAIEVYAKAIELEPTSYELYPPLARTYLQLDKLSDATQVYRRALDRVPDSRDAALRDLWGLYAGKEKKSEGIALLEELAPQMSESPTLHELLGDAYKEAGDGEKANHAYTQWVALRQKEADRNGRAWDFQNLADQILDKEILPEKALELAQRASQLDPSPSYTSTLARAYLVNGQYDKATDELKRALNQSGIGAGAADNTRMIWSSVIKAAKVAKDETRFIQFVNDLAKNMPDNPSAQFHTNLALSAFYRERNQLEEGDKYMNEAKKYMNKTGFVAESAWWIIGPFDNIGGSGYHGAYIPEEATQIDKMAEYPGKNGNVHWKKLQDDTFDGFVDFDQIFGGKLDWVTAYAWTKITSPDERQAQIRFGSDDQAKIWLNGKEVFTFAGARPAAPDQDTIPVTLKAGENTILVKVSDEQVYWGFYLRLTDLNGVPFDDLDLMGDIKD
ncbi:tetratricopeptide repeat protein [Candidatus Poribacteria bacterium]|nr:tetratricopeptide repeat protein [Candidatus Poribacteria bacterium]